MLSTKEFEKKLSKKLGYKVELSDIGKSFYEAMTSKETRQTFFDVVIEEAKA